MNIRKRKTTMGTLVPGAFLLCSAVIVPPSPALPQSQEYEQHIAEGRKLMEEKDFRKAIKAFEAALRSATREREAAEVLGTILEMKPSDNKTIRNRARIKFCHMRSTAEGVIPEEEPSGQEEPQNTDESQELHLVT